MMEKFIGSALKKVEIGEGGIPLSFIWGDRGYHIEKILKHWQDFDFSPLSPKKNWRSRRHRNYYKVVTETGECFEIYCDRGTRLNAVRTWILLRELEED